MAVWYCTPSKRPPAEITPTLAKWRAQGYSICLWRDIGDTVPDGIDHVIVGDYPGHAAAVNACIQAVLRIDSACDWVVNAGDDTEPDPTKRAEEIAAECSEHFGSTFGVMQPTGDWKHWKGSDIRKIAGSPFIGRAFAERAYDGKGPLWTEYYHMFDDEELFNVAHILGVYWAREDLTHQHNHCMRMPGTPVPAFLARGYSPENWHAMGDLYRRRKAQGFPGHEVRT